jgi:hypothetical protein
MAHNTWQLKAVTGVINSWHMPSCPFRLIPLTEQVKHH